MRVLREPGCDELREQRREVARLALQPHTAATRHESGLQGGEGGERHVGVVD